MAAENRDRQADRREPDATEDTETERPLGAPEPGEQADPGWPLPGFPGPDVESPASDADAPAPPG